MRKAGEKIGKGFWELYGGWPHFEKLLLITRSGRTKQGFVERRGGRSALCYYRGVTSDETKKGNCLSGGRMARRDGCDLNGCKRGDSLRCLIEYKRQSLVKGNEPVLSIFLSVGL